MLFQNTGIKSRLQPYVFKHKKQKISFKLALCIAVLVFACIVTGCSTTKVDISDFRSPEPTPTELVEASQPTEACVAQKEELVYKSDAIQAFQDAGYQIVNHYEHLRLHEASQGEDELYTMFISPGIDTSSSAFVIILDNGKIFFRSMANDQPHERIAFADIDGDDIDDVIFQPVTYGADNDGGNIYVFSIKDDFLSTLFVIAYGNTDQYLNSEYKDCFFYISDSDHIMHDHTYSDYTPFISSFYIMDAHPSILCIDHTVGNPELGSPFTHIQWVDNKPTIIWQGYK